MKRRIDLQLAAACGGAIIFLLGTVLLLGGLDAMTSNALKVQHILKTIETAKTSRGQASTRSAIITQEELNAYFAYRLKQDNNPLIKGVNIVLGAQNRVSGRVQIELGSVQILNLLGQRMQFAFDGRLNTQKGGGNLELTSLELNGEAVPPQTLNPILYALAQFYGHEAGGIDDWYELPRGIERIELGDGQAVLYY